MLRFKSFHTSNKTIKGIEAMNMIRKKQIKKANGEVFAEIQFLVGILNIVA